MSLPNDKWVLGNEDAYGEDEQLGGFATMIEDNLDLPFQTKVLGVKVLVVEVVQGRGGAFMAVCDHGGKRQKIPILELPMPAPPPAGAERIDAYRLWTGEG